jgi:transposase-like protein
MVRNGLARPRRITLGAGTIEIAAPRVNDRRMIDSVRQKFSGKIPPPDSRRSPTVETVLPLLYLHGLSTGDFQEALPVLLGDDAAGLSASAITRLTHIWREEYAAWAKRNLQDRDDVYVWVDGVHFTVRLEGEKLAALVIIGARPDGTKEIVAIEDGYRESTKSWLSLLRSLKARGMKAPVVAVGDGALGFWAAMRQVWPTEREPRCWFHKRGNVLDKLPKRLQPRGKRLLQEILLATTKKDAVKAVDCLVNDQDELLQAASGHWRMLNGDQLLPLVCAGVKFIDG